MEEPGTPPPRPNHLPALAFVGLLIGFQNLAIRSDSEPDPFLRPALSVTQAFRIPPELQALADEGAEDDYSYEAFTDQPPSVDEVLEAATDPGPEDFSVEAFDEEPHPPLATEDGEPPTSSARGEGPKAPPAPPPQAPAPGPHEAARPPSGPSPAAASDLEYEVVAGDTLSGIARRFETTIVCLALNNDMLDIHKLRPGMKLRIAKGATIEHRVTTGESLWSIAQMYDMEVAELAALNDLADHKVVSGQKLQIPTRNLDGATYEQVLRRRQGKTAGFALPVVGRMTDHFGMRRHPIYGRKLPHRGLDIAAGLGTPIKASNDGVVSFSGSSAGYGRMVELRHGGGFATRYAHCSKLVVKKGQKVKRGEVIGYVGASGLATAPHLHFELRKGGVPQDPLKHI